MQYVVCTVHYAIVRYNLREWGGVTGTKLSPRGWEWEHIKICKGGWGQSYYHADRMGTMSLRVTL